MRYSLDGKLALLNTALVSLAVAGTAVLATAVDSLPIAAALALLLFIPVAVLASYRFARPTIRTLQALSDGIGSMRDGDFGISVSRISCDELGVLVERYNSLGDLLRSERQSLYQRELLLDTIIQAAPLAMVLTDASGRVVYSNWAARQAMFNGRKLEGASFQELLVQAPEALQTAAGLGADTLFTVEEAGESETYFLSQRKFLLNGQDHSLYLIKQVTRELGRQEVRTWKKVIRVIAHELNNSLAPISSLAHSGRQMAAAPDAAQLQRIFSTIEGRARHLHGFIDGYARFAKLPRPQFALLHWGDFLGQLRNALPCVLRNESCTVSSVFDPAQMEQVLINLIKNAQEAGAAEQSIEVGVREIGREIEIQVVDRGSGMSDEALRSALLPFYSTKPAGAGLGLTICREVIDAHGGRMSMANRKGGGLIVTLWIPAQPQLARGV